MVYLLYQGPDVGDMKAGIWTVMEHNSARVLKTMLDFLIDNHVSANYSQFTLSADPGEGPTHQFDCCVVDRGRFAPNHVRFSNTDRS